MKRRPEEGYWDYLGRLYDNRTEYDLTCEEIADIMNREFGKTCGESKYRKEIRAFNSGREFERNKLRGEGESAYLAELTERENRIKVERAKLQTEKIETNRWIRECARDEMIMEKIIEAIENQKDTYSYDAPVPVDSYDGGWALLFGDAHFGKEFIIRGLEGEILNEYNPEIFYDRMAKLLADTIAVVEKEKIKSLTVFDLGDSTDGILRVSQLMTLRYGVVESAIQYAFYIAGWLEKLSHHVHIRFGMASGNHTELRMLGQPKGAFKEDNMSRVVYTIISMRLKDNPNFEMLESPIGYVYTKISDYNVLAVHGECGNLGRAIHEFENTYGRNIDFVFGAHFHHGKSEDVGRKRGVFSIRSIMGIDDFSISLNKTADAGASLIRLEEGRGHTFTYNICLN